MYCIHVSRLVGLNGDKIHVIPLGIPALTRRYKFGLPQADSI